MSGPEERKRLELRLLWLRARSYGSILMCVLLTGCFHQQQAPPLAQQAKTPNVYVPPPTTDSSLPPMKQDDTPPKLTDAKPVAAAEEVKPKKKVKRQPVPAQTPIAAPATTTATAEAGPTPTPEAALGALAPGGAASPKQQQEAMGKISAVEKRIEVLPSTTAGKEQKQVAKVRLFLKEASDALKGGDVEGAEILATKADLLMDDLTK